MIGKVPEDRCSFVGWAPGPVEGVNCDRPKRLLLPSGDMIHARCRRTDPGVCEPCSTLYRRNVRRVALSGCDLEPGASVFVTFTAPGERQHFLPSGEACPCTPPGGVDLATWNGRAVDRWNDLSRALARAMGVERFEYFRAVEVQKRGALHLHVLLRLPRGARITTGMVRRLAIRHGYGHAVDVQVVRDSRAASYVAKYVSKASGQRHEVPYVHRLTGEIGPGRWRTWVASRAWGETMRSVIAAQACFRREDAEPEGRGPAAGAGAAGALDPRGVSYAPVPSGRSLVGAAAV